MASQTKTLQVKIAGIRERVHQPWRDALVRSVIWKLVPKMKVRCTAQGDPSFDKLGILVPSGIYCEEVVWAVLIDGVRAWDACKEEIIRRDFEPAVIINGEPDKDTTG